MRALISMVKALLPRARAQAAQGIAESTAPSPDTGRRDRLASALTHAVDAIVCTDATGTITDWNPAATALFGHTAHEAAGKAIEALLPGVHEAAGATAAIDVVCPSKDGRALDIALTASRMLDAEGALIGTVYIARDVTERRRADARLRKNEARLRFALEAADIGSWRLDVDTGEVQRSPAHDRCFGYTALLPEWTVATFERHLHPEDRFEVMRRVRQAIETEGEFRAECRVVWADESVHWVVAYGTMAYAVDKVRSMTGIIVDITRRKQAEAARANAVMLEAENRRILDASRAKSIFLANMSHELRTPLNAIIGFSDVLGSGMLPPDSPRQASFIQHINTSGRHLLQLINDVLDLSKVESGRFEFHPEPVDLTALFSEVIDVLHTQILRKHLHVETEVSPDLKEIFLDPSRLKQILFNYVSNAIKFTPDEGDITVRAMPEGSAHLRIEVEDKGCGIAPEHLNSLFIEFSQIANAVTGGQEGTGLGLALSRRLAEAQGGRVGVTSQPGVGSVFSLVLNRVHGTDTLAPAERSMADHGSAPCLLLVHDGPKESALFAHALRDAGMALECATSSEAALQCMQTRQFDALALQLLLPDRHGLQLLADIRTRRWAGDMPVIGLMVHDGTGRTASFAISDVLAKPVRGQQALAMLQRAGLGRGRRSKVLVIDEEPESLDLMETILLETGLTAICRTDGGAALADIENHQPDAIILSLMMSGMNGLDILARVRQLPAGRHIPVFVCSSMALGDSEYETLRYSASAILGQGGGLPGPAVAGMTQALRQMAAPREVPVP